MVARDIKYEEDPKRRQDIFKQRSKTLKKSIFQLSILCDVPACIVMYNPECEPGKQYKVWPKERDKFRHVVDLYKKNGGNGRASCSSRKPKKQNKQQAETTAVKTEANRCSDGPEPRFTSGGGLQLEEKLGNLTPNQAMGVMAMVDKKIGQIQARIDGKISKNMAREEVVNVKLDDADAGALMVVQGMDDIINVADDQVQVFPTAVVRKNDVFNIADEYFDFGAFDDLEGQTMLLGWQPQTYSSFCPNMVCHDRSGSGPGPSFWESVLSEDLTMPRMGAEHEMMGQAGECDKGLQW